eukprot:s170_g7.t1
MSKRPDLNLPSQPLKVEADREGVAPVTAILPWLSALPLQTRADPRDVLVEVVPEVLLAEVARLPVARGRSSRKNPGVSVDALSFDFVVQNQEGLEKGLEKGAKWDTNAGCLADADTMALFNPMPIVHFKPVVRKKAVTEGIYQCPLYLYPIRTGTRERPSFMIWVDLKAGSFSADQWTKRGTALLLSVAS